MIVEDYLDVICLGTAVLAFAVMLVLQVKRLFHSYVRTGQLVDASYWGAYGSPQNVPAVTLPSLSDRSKDFGEIQPHIGH